MKTTTIRVVMSGLCLVKKERKNKSAKSLETSRYKKSKSVFSSELIISYEGVNPKKEHQSRDGLGFISG